MAPDDRTAPTGLTFRELSGPTELAAASALIAEVFGEPYPSMPVDVLVAITSAGGFVGGALQDQQAGQDQQLVGVAVGIGEIGAPGSEHLPGLHSHIAAVRGSARGLRIGQQLKWFQRSWALERGLQVIHWTFDPLVRRNAVMNLNRLGAVASTYHDNLYGVLPDTLNNGMDSDRLLVRWELDSPRVHAAFEGLGRDRTNGVIETPADIEILVRTDLPAAQEWRRKQRQAFHALDAGWTVTGIDAEGSYEVEYV